MPLLATFAVRIANHLSVTSLRVETHHLICLVGDAIKAILTAHLSPNPLLGYLFEFFSKARHCFAPWIVTEHSSS
jgi:hypothetical protein